MPGTPQACLLARSGGAGGGHSRLDCTPGGGRRGSGVCHPCCHVRLRSQFTAVLSPLTFSISGVGPHFYPAPGPTNSPGGSVQESGCTGCCLSRSGLQELHTASWGALSPPGRVEGWVSRAGLFWGRGLMLETLPGLPQLREGGLPRSRTAQGTTSPHSPGFGSDTASQAPSRDTW